jgi:hypothetical protein
MARVKKSAAKRVRKPAALRVKAARKTSRKSANKLLPQPSPKGTSSGAPPKGTSFGARALELHNQQVDHRPRVLATQQQQVEKIIAAAQPGAVSTDNCFVYFAAFDGTSNDAVNAGSFQTTNVRQLWRQFEPGMANHPNLGGGYFAGPGTKGTLKLSSWLSPRVTAQVRRTAAAAYRDFAQQASAWLADHPEDALSVVVTSFSRGVASAAIFTQLLHEKGLATGRGRDRQKSAVTVTAGVNFDPVATGVKCNIAYARNCAHIVNLRAQDEYRQLFRAVDYSAQAAIVTTIPMLGNHCDIGGGYDNGLAALALEAATAFLQRSGLPLGAVGDRAFAGVESIAIHSEDSDEGQELQSKWDVYWPGPQINTFDIVDDLALSPRLSARLAVATAEEIVLA